jgi:hypothetical protein
MECIICTHSRMYKRQQSPSWWLPSGPVIPNVTVEHGPGGLCPTQAVSGPHGAPRAASHRWPRDAREGETAPRGRPRPASCGQRPALRTCATRAGAQRDGREAAEKALAVTTRVQRRLRRAASDRLAASWAALRPQRQQERRPSPQGGAAERLRAAVSEAVCASKDQQVARLA